MHVVAIGADHVLPLAQSLVRDHVHRDADRADGASGGTEGLLDLLLLGRPELLAEGLEQLHLAEPVVAAHEREDDAAVGHDRHGLRRRARIHAEKLRDVLDRALPWRLDLLRLGQLLGEVGRRRAALRDLEIRRVVAVFAGHERVLARAGGSEEVLAAASAHDPRLRCDLVGLEPAALEDLRVRDRVLAEALVETGLVAVERVAVLHDELAKAEQRPARPGLVAVLRLKVVPDLRQLLVRPDLARVEGNGLLVRERQDVVAARPVLEVEELGDADPSGRLPELRGRQHRHQDLLCAEGVELLADDLLDLPVHAPAERQEGPEAAGDLANEAAADEQLVRDRLRVGGIVAQGRQKEL